VIVNVPADELVFVIANKIFVDAGDSLLNPITPGAIGTVVLAVVTTSAIIPVVVGSTEISLAASAVRDAASV
jgi:hypothetical protein